MPGDFKNVKPPKSLSKKTILTIKSEPEKHCASQKTDEVDTKVYVNGEKSLCNIENIKES